MKIKFGWLLKRYNLIMIITNFKNLARNPLRKKALEIVEAGYEAVDIQKTVSQRIKLKNNKLSIYCGVMMHHNTQKSLDINLNNYQNVFLVGIGKGSALACASLAKILRERLTEGIALDIQKPKLEITSLREVSRRERNPKLKILLGTHPLPSRQNIKATQEIIKLAKSAGKDDLIISFICGGGSSLLCGSETELSASRIIFKELTKRGADIIELNNIRKHLSEVKGGNLAKLAYPASIVSLIVSDVLGNDLPMVASGPTIFDETTKKDAVRILKKYRIQDTRYKIQLFETPKDKKYFKKVKIVLFLSNNEPIIAMAEKAKKLGFKTRIYSLKLNGEARNVLPPLIKASKRNSAILAAGETTVNLQKKVVSSKYQATVKGGRNQEAVLGTIVNFLNTNYLILNTIIISFASDGRDNTEAAGAIADYLTIEKVKKMNLNPEKFLENHDSFNFFKKTGDLIFTEPKTFNVSDLMLVLKENS